MAEEQNEQAAQTHWSNFAHVHDWYIIPDTIPCDRTFARTPIEAYYLERMHNFIEIADGNGWAADFDVRATPLAAIREGLTGRWWSQFTFLQMFRIEQYAAENFRLLVPGDSYDTRINQINMEYLRGVYPRSAQWYNNYLFQAEIPFPLPLVVFYYQNRIRLASCDRERSFWERPIEMELSMLFAVAWYSEAVHGLRGYVLPLNTAFWLRERLGDVLLVAGTGPGGM